MQREEKKKILNNYLLQEAKISRLNNMSILNPEREKYFNRKISEAEIFRKKTEKCIKALNDTLLSEILFQKYILGKTLEQISFTLNYSKRHIERLHIKALEKLDLSALQTEKNDL